MTAPDPHAFPSPWRWASSPPASPAPANANVDVVNFSFSPATVTHPGRRLGDLDQPRRRHHAQRPRQRRQLSLRQRLRRPTRRQRRPEQRAWTATLVFTTAGTFPYHCARPRPGDERHGGGEQRRRPATPARSSFSNTSYTSYEGTAHAAITVQRVGGDDGAASVHYATSNGSAVAGSDYAATSGNLSWADHDGGNKTFAVPIINDSTPEGNESVNLALSNATGAALASPSTATLTIVDNDTAGPAGTLSFTAAEQSVAEGAGSATAAVQRTGGTNGAVSVGLRRQRRLGHRRRRLHPRRRHRHLRRRRRGEQDLRRPHPRRLHDRGQRDRQPHALQPHRRRRPGLARRADPHHPRRRRADRAVRGRRLHPLPARQPLPGDGGLPPPHRLRAPARPPHSVHRAGGDVLVLQRGQHRDADQGAERLRRAVQPLLGLLRRHHQRRVHRHRGRHRGAAAQDLHNPQGMAALPVQDTDAFATCP